MTAGAGKRTKKRQPEQVFQASLVKSLAMVLDPSCVLFAVPNGGFRTAIEAKVLIGQGVLPGMPDLMVLFGGTAAGMELKAPKGALTAAQVAIHQRLARAGIPVAVVRNLEEALAFLRRVGAPLRIKSPERS